MINGFINAGTKYEYRQYFVDHKGGYLDKNYFVENENDALNEYLKAESNYLTIDPTMRLQQEVQTLKIVKSRMDALEQQMKEFNSVLAQFKNE